MTMKTTMIIGIDESDNSEKSRFQVPATPGLEPWRPGLVLVALLVNIIYTIFEEKQEQIQSKLTALKIT